MKELSTEYLTLRAAATSVLIRYTGWNDLRPRQVEVVEDPEVSGVIAVQVVRRGSVHQFLYERDIGVDSVNEVEFTRWPPRSKFSVSWRWPK